MEAGSYPLPDLVEEDGAAGSDALHGQVPHPGGGAVRDEDVLRGREGGREGGRGEREGRRGGRRGGREGGREGGERGKEGGGEGREGGRGMREGRSWVGLMCGLLRG